MRFPDRFLEELRQALPIVDAARRHYKLKRKGSEWVCVDDPSLSINAAKNVWADFGKGQRAGDVFALEMFATGCTFEAAVEAIAKVAGLPLPGGRGEPQPRTNGRASDEPPPNDGPPEGHPAAAQRQRAPERELTATYDYQDRDGLVIYQVARFEWDEDGKRHKTTLPRRAAPDEPDHWIWGMKGGLHLRGRSGDWYQADAKRLREWKGADRHEFEEVAPRLYRLPELLDEVAQDETEQRPIFVPEGEKDADTLAAWGLVATTNMGGVNGWQPHFHEYFQGADVVIPMDHDAGGAGKRFAHLKAASLKPFARRIRLLDWREHWPDVPNKGDVTKWRDDAGGTVERLFEIVDKLPDWTAEPPVSAFNARRFFEIDRVARPLAWTIKSILQRATVSLWYGAPSCGKSFLLTDAAMSIARGVPWMGQRTKAGLVIYQTGEGGVGFGLRLKAYRAHMRLPPEDDVPFVYLPVRINLFLADADVDKLIAEIKAWAAFYDHPLELVVIDTFNAAAGGANENANQDVGKVLDRCRRIVDQTGAHVAVVHHTPVTGTRPRGHSSLVGDVETTIAVEETEQIDREDRDGRVIQRAVRSWTLTKQKDGPDRISRSFVLKAVSVGNDDDGDDVTSCIVAPLDTAAARASSREIPRGWVQLHAANEDIFRALVRALRKHGRPAPPGIEAPRGAQCCEIAQWQDELLETMTGHEEVTPTLRGRIKARIYRASKGWMPDRVNLIGKHREYVWRTERRVHMVDTPPVLVEAQPSPGPLLAAGETAKDVGDLF